MEENVASSWKSWSLDFIFHVIMELESWISLCISLMICKQFLMTWENAYTMM